MPAPARLIRARIKSVKNTKKITKAMELVSAAKMRKAVAAVVGTRPYARLSSEAVREMNAKLEESLRHPLMRARAEVKNVLVLVFTSDKGLCGGFNAQLLKKTAQFIREKETAGIGVKFIAIGKRGATFFRNKADALLGVFTDLNNAPTSLSTRPIAKLAIDAFLEERVDEIYVASTEFKSALSQTPTVKKLLPLGTDHGSPVEPGMTTAEYLFEPDPRTLLDLIVPRLAEVLLFQSLLESNASEHSARMMTMKNATGAASDMIDDLTFSMNQARQAAITREISEISAGKAALE